jgi:hypothetical protein
LPRFESTGRLAAAAGALVAAVLVAATGCGSSSSKSSSTTTGSDSSETTTTTGTKTVSKEQWASNFCTAVSTWSTSLRSAGKSLQTSTSKGALQSTGDEIKSANEQFANDLRSLGRPSVPQAQRVKGAADQLAAELQKDAASIEKIISSASGGQGQLLNAAADVSHELVLMGNAMTSILTQLQGAAQQGKNSLGQAFQQANSCQKLQKSNS